MVVMNKLPFKERKPTGYKVAARNRVQLRAAAAELRPLLGQLGCFPDGPHLLDAKQLLEDVLHRAGYVFHPDDSGELLETAAFAVPEKKLIVIREDVYEALHRDDPFARYTVVHEFSHIYLDHAVTLHRGARLGEHQWWEDSEWQANNLTAELLMPVDSVKALGAHPLLIQAECGVSAPAVMHRLDNLRREGLLGAGTKK